MSKKIRDKKVTLITAIIFLSVVSVGYFYSIKPAGNENNNITAITTQDRLNDEEEALAKEEFVHSKLTCEEYQDEAIDKIEFVQSEMMRDNNEDEMAVANSAECVFADEESLEQKDESILNDLSDTEVKMTLISSKDNNDKGAAEILDHNDKMPVEQSSKSLHESKGEIKDANIDFKSLFSADAQVLPVVIANEVEQQIVSENDPYEEPVVPKKAEVLNTTAKIEEPTKNPPKIEAAFSVKAVPPSTEGSETRRSKAYLNATSTFARLLTKFLQKVDYTKELNDLDQINLPIEIREFFSELKDFAENDIKNSAESNTKIFPKEGVIDKIAGHFVQVEKISDSKHRNERYERLSKKLLTLEEYFYSQKFLNEMMGHD